MDLPPPTNFEKPEQEKVISVEEVKKDLESARVGRDDEVYNPYEPDPDPIAPNVIKYGKGLNLIAKFTYDSSEIKVDIKNLSVVIKDKTSGESNEFTFEYSTLIKDSKINVLDESGKKMFVFNFNTGQVTQYTDNGIKEYTPNNDDNNISEEVFTGPLSSNITITPEDALKNIENPFQLKVKFDKYSIRLINNTSFFLYDYTKATDETGPNIKPYLKPETHLVGNTMIIVLDTLDVVQINLKSGNGVFYTGDGVLNLSNSSK